MSLQDLPAELTESVALLLSFSDLCSLRLTSKRLAFNTAQKHFKTKFRSKRMEFTEQQLRSFVAVTACGGLGCQIQDLTLVAPVYSTSTLTARLEDKRADFADLDDEGRLRGRRPREDLTDDELRQTGLDLVVLKARFAEQVEMIRHHRDVELLSQAFSNLAAHGVTLRMLRTEVEIYKDDTTTPLLPLFGGYWEPIWEATAHVSHTLFTSLDNCNLPLHNLDLFNSARMVRCSLTYDNLNAVDFASSRFAGSLGHLKRLSMRISEDVVKHRPKKVIPDGESSDEESFAEAANGSEFEGLRSLLRTCPRVQELDLTHFSLKHFDRAQRAQLPCHHILRVLAELNVPSLLSLTLQGFRTTGSELLTLLQGLKSLRGLSLLHVRLMQGRFKPILDYCTLEADMETLELDSLFESDIIQFGSPWALQGTGKETVFQGCLHTRASYRRTSDGVEDRKIRHHILRGRTYDSPLRRAWFQDIENRFGPLGKDGKPSWLQPHVSSLAQTWQWRQVNDYL